MENMISELRQKLEDIESKYGDMPVCIRLDDGTVHEATTGITFKDDVKVFMVTRMPQNVVAY